MRISDWSSDVCSSDLQPGNIANAGDVALGHYVAHAFNADANGKDSEVFAEDYKSKTGHYPVYIERQTVFGLQLARPLLKGVMAQAGKLKVTAFARARDPAKFTTTVGQAGRVPTNHQVRRTITLSQD